MKGRTSFAQRTGFPPSADKIMVIDKGVIAESGTHNELMNKTVYTRLNEMQFDISELASPSLS